MATRIRFTNPPRHGHHCPVPHLPPAIMGNDDAAIGTAWLPMRSGFFDQPAPKKNPPPDGLHIRPRIPGVSLPDGHTLNERLPTNGLANLPIRLELVSFGY